VPDVVLGWPSVGRPVLVVQCSCVLRLSRRNQPGRSLRVAACVAVLVSPGGVGIDLPRRAELLSLALSVALSSAWGAWGCHKLRECRRAPEHGHDGRILTGNGWPASPVTSALSAHLPHNLHRLLQIPFGIDLGHVGRCVPQDDLGGFQPVPFANLRSGRVA